MSLGCNRRLVTGYLRLSDNLAMMIRVSVLPQEVKSVRTRSRKGDTAWFVDRHMQELLMLIYEELSGRMKPAAAEMKSQATLFKRGNGFRAAFYFSRHGYIQHLVIPKEHAKLSTNTSLQGHGRDGCSFRLHPEAVYAVVDDLEVPSNGGVAKACIPGVEKLFLNNRGDFTVQAELLNQCLLSEKGGTKDITAYFACPTDQEDKENVLPILSVNSCHVQPHRKSSKVKKVKTGKATASTVKDATKSQLQATVSHQLKLDTLLNKKDANIHVVKSYQTDSTASSDVNLNADVLSSELAASPELGQPCHKQSCHTNNTNLDVIDCLFDDIDFNDLFDSEPLPLMKNDILNNQHKGSRDHEGSCDHKRSCDHDMSCDLVEVNDDTIIEVPETDDNDDDVTDMSTVSCSSSTISFDDVVMVERDGKNHELSRRTIFRKTSSIKELSNKQIGRWIIFRKYFIRDIMAGKVPCERHNKYKESNNARRVIRNESFIITAFTRDQLEYIIDHLKKLFELDGLLNYDYVMSVLLIEVSIHIIMDLHQVDYHIAEKTLMA